MNNGIHTFPKSISLKVNIAARLEFKLTFFHGTVQYFSHYAMETPHYIVSSIPIYTNNLYTIIGFQVTIPIS